MSVVKSRVDVVPDEDVVFPPFHPSLVIYICDICKFHQLLQNVRIGNVILQECISQGDAVSKVRRTELGQVVINKRSYTYFFKSFELTLMSRLQLLCHPELGCCSIDPAIEAIYVPSITDVKSVEDSSDMSVEEDQ